jgi:hypothetical protein
MSARPMVRVMDIATSVVGVSIYKPYAKHVA